MKYDRIRKAVFIERPNRFIAHVDLEGKRETVHVKNTGRCAELLVPGTEVYIQESSLSEDNAADFMNITVRQSRQSGVARATCPD